MGSVTFMESMMGTPDSPLKSKHWEVALNRPQAKGKESTGVPCFRLGGGA